MGVAVRSVRRRDRGRARRSSPRRPLRPQLTSAVSASHEASAATDVERPADHSNGGSFRVGEPGSRRWWLLLVCSLALIGIGVVGAELARVRHELDLGRTILQQLDLATVDDQGGLATVVDRAADHLDAADAVARHSPVLRFLSVVPVVRGQVDGLRELTGAVAELGSAGRTAGDAIQNELDHGSGPASRIRIAEVAADALTDVRATLSTIELGEGWLLPPLASARTQLADELEEADGDLERGTALVRALQRFLEGPRRYLILGGNNAEMRSGGIPTTSGIATIADGGIHVGDFSGASNGIELEYPGVPVPDDYRSIYGFLNGAQGYRTTTATANWPLAAEIMAEITARNRYGPVDGIIFVDTITLTTLLSVVGPVDVDGVTYTAENTAEELLYRNYLRYGTFDVDSQEQRRRLQSDVANAIFDAVEEREYSITKLAGLLSALARNRDLLAWSADPEENELWQAFGADGALLPNTIGVISNQLNASKLDYFARMEVAFDSHVEGDRNHITMAITVINPEHSATTPYIDGGGEYAESGEVGSQLVAYLPQGADDVQNDDPGIVAVAPDGDTLAVSMITRVPEGEQRTVTLRFTLPLRPDDVLRVLPSARLTPTLWTVDGRSGTDRQQLEIHLAPDRSELVAGVGTTAATP